MDFGDGGWAEGRTAQLQGTVYDQEIARLEEDECEHTAGMDALTQQISNLTAEKKAQKP